jgi:hypothetical protein
MIDNVALAQQKGGEASMKQPDCEGASMRGGFTKAGGCAVVAYGI